MDPNHPCLLLPAMADATAAQGAPAKSRRRSGGATPTKREPTSVLVVHPHALLRQALAALAAAWPGAGVVADAGTVREAAALAADGRPGIVLVDEHVPGVSSGA